MAEEYVLDEWKDNPPEEELSEVEISNLPEKEFRVMIIKMIKELGRRMDTQSENLVFFNKELENRTTKQRWRIQ